MIFVDTSALYALLDEDDDNHVAAAALWQGSLLGAEPVTHAYVLVETSALVQRRLGHAAVRQLHRGLLPAVHQLPVDWPTHQRAVARWLAASRRGLSLVDVTSFVVMEDLGIDRAFAFDGDFARAGFGGAS